MARYRTIKPDFFTDEKLNEISRDARLLFIGLLVFSDDMGRHQYSPSRLRSEIFPRDQIADEAIDRWVTELIEQELIRLYTVGKQRYIWIPNFLRHQRIDRPSHTFLPQHPKDRKPQCLCPKCKARANAESVPEGTQRFVESTSLRIDDSRTSRVEINQNQIQNQHQEQNQNLISLRDSDGEFPSLESTVANRRAEQAAVAEIAMRMLTLLELNPQPDSLLIATVIKSIEVRARSKACTHEAAAQMIAARAAWVAADTPPEDWVQWFADSRYEYVPQGDKRLLERRLEARPVCGGTRCEEGYESITINGHAVLRRCPDCARLWRDLGL